MYEVIQYLKINISKYMHVRMCVWVCGGGGVVAVVIITTIVMITCK